MRLAGRNQWGGAVWAAALILLLSACGGALGATASLPPGGGAGALVAPEAGPGMARYEDAAFFLVHPAPWLVEQTEMREDGAAFVTVIAASAKKTTSKVTVAYTAGASGQAGDIKAKDAQAIVDGIGAQAGVMYTLESYAVERQGLREAVAFSYRGALSGVDICCLQQIVPVEGGIYVLTFTIVDGAEEEAVRACAESVWFY